MTKFIPDEAEISDQLQIMREMTKEHNLASILDAPTGAVIRFIYNGGSNPGSLRQVKVTQTGYSYIRGEDQIDNNQIKTFSATYAKDVMVLSWPDKDVVEPFFKFDTFGDLIIVNGDGDELMIVAEPDDIPCMVAIHPADSQTIRVNPEQLTEHLMKHLGITK